MEQTGTGPQSHPQMSLIVNGHAIGGTQFRRDLDNAAAIADAEIFAVKVKYIDLVAAGIAIVQQSGLLVPGQAIGVAHGEEQLLHLTCGGHMVESSVSFCGGADGADIVVAVRAYFAVVKPPAGQLFRDQEGFQSTVLPEIIDAIRHAGKESAAGGERDAADLLGIGSYSLCAGGQICADHAFAADIQSVEGVVFLVIQSAFAHQAVAAALCDSWEENGEVKISADFIDEMARQCDGHDLGLSLRLQGYVQNFRGHKNFIMLNHQGEELRQDWFSFMIASFHHPGINRDTEDLTACLAKHYEKFPAVMSYQIFNEPHYPANGEFDYNPYTLNAYRKTLVDRGILSEEEAAKYQVPTRRPSEPSEVEAWVDWRRFAVASMCNHLSRFGKTCLEIAPHKDTYTCYVAPRGVDDLGVQGGVTPFDEADGLTTVGITIYSPFVGSGYYVACEMLALFESAAAVEGKKAWTAELDARVGIPIRNFLTQTYAVVGAGHKGINLYEWRGDYAAEGTPLPDNCGLIYNDRTPTKNFDRKIAMIKLINSLSEELATGQRVRCGMAILYSDEARLRSDAAASPALGGINRVMHATYRIYRDLLRRHYRPDFVRAKDLKDNVLGVKTLFVPRREDLPREEMEAIDAFVAQGGKVYYFGVTESMHTVDGLDGYKEWTKFSTQDKHTSFISAYELEDVLEQLEASPLVTTSHRNLFCEVMETEENYILTLVNNAQDDKMLTDVTVTPSGLKPISGAVLHTTLGVQELVVENGVIHVPSVDAGGFVICRKA